MNALVVGFGSEDTRRLSKELRTAGHHVLGAVGKQGVWTFLHAISPDVVLVPEGADGERAREWVLEVTSEVDFLDVPAGVDVVTRLARFLRGDPLEDPPPVPAPEPITPVVDLAPADVVAPAGLLASRVGDTRPNPRPATASGALPAPPATDVFDRVDSRRRARPPEGESEAREPHPDLASKLAQVRFGDYHSILECEPQASPYAVRELRDRLARKYSPRGWPHRLNPEEIDILNEISRGIADAFLILSDPELAMRYERALAGSTAPMSPPDALPR